MTTLTTKSRSMLWRPRSRQSSTGMYSGVRALLDVAPRFLQRLQCWHYSGQAVNLAHELRVLDILKGALNMAKRLKGKVATAVPPGAAERVSSIFSFVYIMNALLIPRSVEWMLTVNNKMTPGCSISLATLVAACVLSAAAPEPGPLPSAAVSNYPECAVCLAFRLS